MGHHFVAVGWNRQKRIYDLLIAIGVLIYAGSFVGIGAVLFPDATAETLLIRALGSCALIMLHVILVIGPLHRLWPWTAPLLYNRRHLGVAMFVVALAHGIFATIQFHLLGPLNPFISILTDGGGPVDSGPVNFQIFGLIALCILFLMAATSHDFWLSRLTPAVWKSLHLGVYGAYALLVAHVAFGIAQQAGSGLWLAPLTVGVIAVGGLHATAGYREWRRDTALRSSPGEEWIRLTEASDIAMNRALTFSVAGDRVAVFQHEGGYSAVSNTCRHQGGPLGEGRVINGCIVCPWHGYEYDPATGCAPAPFTEKVPTFNLKMIDGVLWIQPTPNPSGTPVEPVLPESNG